MKKTIFIAVALFISVFANAESVTFSKWECTAIVESVDKSGNVSYSAHYHGKVYQLDIEQYYNLIYGEDVTIEIKK